MLIHGLYEFFVKDLLIGSIAMTSNTLIIFAAFAIAVLITGPISGGHLNPAVTLWALMSGKIGTSRAIHHMIAQLLAVVAVYLVKSRI
jgi:glycerol uptake facilitator-like aquaporin